MDWLASKTDNLQQHLAQPEVSVEEHVHRKRAELGTTIWKKRRFYLDTKYWIRLRDVTLGRPSDAKHVLIYESLKRLTKSERCICLISYSVFTELIKQSDVSTRTATANLIDDLSDCVCTLPPHDIVAAELQQFLEDHAAIGPKTDPISSVVWTKIPFVLGNCMLQTDSFTDNENLAMAKAMDDVLWQTSLKEFLSVSDQAWPSRAESDATLAKTLTEGKFEHDDEFASFDEVFMLELAGTLDFFKGLCSEIIIRQYKATGASDEVSPNQRKQAGQQFANLIYHAFRLKKISTELPGMHISACLHAAVRNDRKRKDKPNDFEDFRHAATALPYFDYFFTEKSLTHTLCTKPLQLDRTYGTRVEWCSDGVLDCLESVEDEILGTV